MKEFNDKTVYIPGGSSGIGLSTAKLMAAAGAHVIIFARTESRLKSALAEIETVRASQTQRTAHMQLDVSSNKKVNEVMKKAVREFGTPDLLINCAGRAYPRYFEDITFEQFDETMRINTYGTWNTCQTLVPHMKKKGGVIVNTSSLAGFMGVFGYTDYSASKFAVFGFSEALRSEVKPYGITVQVLCPPDTDTPGFETENSTKPRETKVLSETASVMTPDEVARHLLKGIRKGSPVIIPGGGGKLTYYAKRFVPWIVEMVMDRDIRKVQEK